MIILKNLQLNNDAIQVLNTLIEMDIKASSAFKLMRIIKEISSLVEDKVKTEKFILNKWAEKDNEGKSISVYDENGNIVHGAVKIIDVSKFENDMKEFLDMETKLKS